MTQKNLVLAEKITDNLGKLERSIQDAEEGWQRFISSDDYLYLSVVALNLHSFYTGAEKQFTLIAKILQERIPSNAQWHERLSCDAFKLHSPKWGRLGGERRLWVEGSQDFIGSPNIQFRCATAYCSIWQQQCQDCALLSFPTIVVML